jgi:hypothetical protein
MEDIRNLDGIWGEPNDLENGHLEDREGSGMIPLR